jgi:hypothetical protein
MCGCAAIAGIDQFSEGQCAGGDCDGGVGADVIKQGDAPVDQSVADQVAKDVVTQDVVSGDDASDGGTTTNDSGGNDGGCGATNTITNCSGCGLACDVVHSNSPVCNGVTCGYGSCHTGYSDCDTTAPDTDGCECATPSCCGSSCATTHSNGLGENYYDCTAKSTYNSTQAMEACAAYTGNQSLCSTAGCTGPGSNLVACGAINGKCACWNYSGSNVTHVTTSANSTCYCPTSSDPTWN